MSNPNVRHIVIDVWGDLACFTRPETKVERYSYPCMTPSAARNILCSIYMKPIEFYYEIEKIEIMNEIKYINIMKNELKGKISYLNPQPLYTRAADDKGRTQRNTYYLKNVYYRIFAKIVKRNDWYGNIDSVFAQFNRRVGKGQCFRQPYLGLRECVCHFSEPDYSKHPNETINEDIGNMLYDVFNINSNVRLVTGKQEVDSTNISFFEANIKNGILEVPPFNSAEIRRVKNAETYL